MLRYTLLKRSFVLAMLCLLVWVTPTFAHQPFFEEGDVTADAPWPIQDISISLSLYGTLESERDVDYFAFQGRAGQTTPIDLLIPQIPGLEEYAPWVALMGPGLPDTALPPTIVRSIPGGAILYEPPTNGGTFFEPFTRSSYWWRQRNRVTLPADGRYVIAVWHPTGEVGRYVLAVGQREIPGGDPQANAKRARYWTPVPKPNTETAPVVPTATPPPARSFLPDWLENFLRRNRFWPSLEP